MIEEMEIENAHEGIGRVLKLVRSERERQITKWGPQTNTPLEWYAILGEEFGEIGKALAEGEIKEFDVATLPRRVPPHGGRCAGHGPVLGRRHSVMTFWDALEQNNRRIEAMMALPLSELEQTSSP